MHNQTKAAQLTGVDMPSFILSQFYQNQAGRNDIFFLNLYAQSILLTASFALSQVSEENLAEVRPDILYSIEAAASMYELAATIQGAPTNE